MKSAEKRSRVLLILLIAVSGLLPIVGYWLLIGQAPTVTAKEAKARLNEPNLSAALVDLREPAAFSEKHLAGAENWPFEELMATTRKEQIPSALQGKPLYLICVSGIRSALAAKKLKALSLPQVFSVRGGMQAWMNATDGLCPLRFCKLALPGGQVEPLPFIPLSRFKQWVAVIVAFGVKPLYMLLSLGLIVILWRQNSQDLVELRWALIAFLVGESFCAMNYLFFHEDSYLLENLHSLGMVLAFGLTASSLFTGLDLRVIHYRDAEKRCAALPLCGACVKYSDVPCQLRRLFLLLCVMFGFLTLIPLLAPFRPNLYNTTILNTLYAYSHPVIHQIYEIRFAPIMSLLLFAGAFFLLWLKREEAVTWAQPVFCLAVGFLGFSFFRLVLLQVFTDDLVWFVAWEEITELMFMVGVGFTLWIFRKRLFLPATPPEKEPVILIAQNQP